MLQNPEVGPAMPPRLRAVPCAVPKLPLDAVDPPSAKRLSGLFVIPLFIVAAAVGVFV